MLTRALAAARAVLCAAHDVLLAVEERAEERRPPQPTVVVSADQDPEAAEAITNALLRHTGTWTQ